MSETRLDLPAPDVSDPDLKKALEEICQALPIDGRVMQVKEFRDDIKQVRLKAANGTIVVVSGRADIAQAEDATLVMSLKTLHESFAGVIQKTIEAARRRGRPASDLLMGLPAPALSTSIIDLDFDALAHSEAPEGSDLEFVTHAPVSAVDSDDRGHREAGRQRAGTVARPREAV